MGLKPPSFLASGINRLAVSRSWPSAMPLLARLANSRIRSSPFPFWITSFNNGTVYLLRPVAVSVLKLAIALIISLSTIGRPVVGLALELNGRALPIGCF